MFQIVADWLKRRRESAELDALDDSQRARVASDLGVSATELDFLVREAHDPVQLPKMLAALGIDEAALRRAEPAMTRDMLRVCSLCTTTDACKYALAQGFADLAYPNYCPNAEALSTLPRRAARPTEPSR
jgi:uncharacterized protein YjiS (DUF1127 family)